MKSRVVWVKWEQWIRLGHKIPLQFQTWTKKQKQYLQQNVDGYIAQIHFKVFNKKLNNSVKLIKPLSLYKNANSIFFI